LIETLWNTRLVFLYVRLAEFWRLIRESAKTQKIKQNKDILALYMPRTAFYFAKRYIISLKNIDKSEINAFCFLDGKLHTKRKQAEPAYSRAIFEFVAGSFETTQKRRQVKTEKKKPCFLKSEKSDNLKASIPFSLGGENGIEKIKKTELCGGFFYFLLFKVADFLHFKKIGSVVFLIFLFFIHFFFKKEGVWGGNF